MKTAKLGFILLVVALLFFVVAYILLNRRQINMSARLMVGSFTFMLAGLGLITFDKRWAKERHEIEKEEEENDH